MLHLSFFPKMEQGIVGLFVGKPHSI
jgi:hypothetical protein